MDLVGAKQWRPVVCEYSMEDGRLVYAGVPVTRLRDNSTVLRGLVSRRVGNCFQ